MTFDALGRSAFGTSSTRILKTYLLNEVVWSHWKGTLKQSLAGEDSRKLTHPVHCFVSDTSTYSVYLFSVHHLGIQEANRNGRHAARYGDTLR